jgi:hypothetical protein
MASALRQNPNNPRKIMSVVQIRSPEQNFAPLQLELTEWTSLEVRVKEVVVKIFILNVSFHKLS